jgi:hypothetical protein
MNTDLFIGTRIVVLALIAYSIGMLIEQKTRLVRTAVVVFLTLGITMDIAATTLMIMGSAKPPFSVHGALGYSALFVMLLATILLWRHRLNSGSLAEVPMGLHLYSRYAYAWWVLTFVVGGLLVLLN